MHSDVSHALDMTKEMMRINEGAGIGIAKTYSSLKAKG